MTVLRIPTIPFLGILYIYMHKKLRLRSGKIVSNCMQTLFSAKYYEKVTTCSIEERTRQEVVLSFVKVLLWHLFGGTEKNCEK